MTRVARILCAFYGAVSVVLGYAAVDQAVHGAAWAAPVLAACSLAPLAGWLREAEHADERAIAQADADRAVRTRALRDDVEIGWRDLEACCCLQAWESHGTAHDPITCARKDQAA
ncbi:hypothetical protein [Streptomyces sp. NPDC021356]|uniref:hypothetical protein n=1 Tax=Streptomyces sp. NPDC021356 TaxID=3154900 RepID=UPI0033F89CC3